MSPIRFEFDARRFGVVRFILSEKKGAAAKGTAPAKALQKALAEGLSEALDVAVETRRERLFGPRVDRFRFHGETITLRPEPGGAVMIDLGAMDDEARETLIETLRHSFEFTQV